MLKVAAFVVVAVLTGYGLHVFAQNQMKPGPPGHR